MSKEKIIFYGVFVITALAVFTFYARSDKPVRSALKGMLSGIAALLLVHFTGGNIGADLPINFFTTSVSLLLGIPAVIIMAVLSI